ATAPFSDRLMPEIGVATPSPMVTAVGARMIGLRSAELTAIVSRLVWLPKPSVAFSSIGSGPTRIKVSVNVASVLLTSVKEPRIDRSRDRRGAGPGGGERAIAVGKRYREGLAGDGAGFRNA